MATFIGLAGCTGTKTSIKPAGAAPLHIDPKTLEKIKGRSDVTLLSHQILPIDYLHKNPHLKGILVNHYMGTGKTYLGIGFAQSYPDRPVILLAPKFLESHWKNEIATYGVTNPSRFTFVSYEDAPAKLATMDVSNHILLADEVHNLVKKMRSMDAQQNASYTQVYSNLRNAYKILGLSGTPIYGDESDIAFIINFVSGKNLLPFNGEEFRLEYTKINATRQFFRGYFTEHNLVLTAAPYTLALISTAVFGPFGVLALPVSLGALISANLLYDPQIYRLREFDAEKMRPMLADYVSYFKFDESKFEDFPAMDFEIKEIPYNRNQYSFFLHLVEGDLPVQELQRLLKNEPVRKSDEFVSINSSAIHHDIVASMGAGRDIGNFEFGDIEAPKFVELHKSLLENNEQTVIYSNYYHTGIVAFENFLKRKDYREKFAIITPDMSVEDVNDIVRKYNNTEIRLLLLHPDVTEGISLRGTQYMHILEPVLNPTVLEQIIGRARRFRSHSHLPKSKQVVKVRMWQSTSSAWDFDTVELRRANWFKRYREYDYTGGWGLGIGRIDKNIDKKIFNPEEIALRKLESLRKNLAAVEEVLKTESIEHHYAQ